MKVSHQSDEMLILDHVPWVMAIAMALLVLVFVGIGILPIGFSDEPMWYLFSFMFTIVGGGLWLMALELFARRLQFVFDRRSDRITLRRLSIFNRSEVRHKLSTLIEARLQHSTGENGQRLLRPVLILRRMRGNDPGERHVPLHEYYTSGPGPEAMADAINQWLATTGAGVRTEPGRDRSGPA